MALPRERSWLDEVAASKYHVAGRIPKWEPMATLSPFPLFRSRPEQFQSEFWGNTPYPWPVLSLLEHKCTSPDCERKEDLCLHVEEGHCPLSLHPTASNDQRQARRHALTAPTLQKMAQLSLRPGSDGQKPMPSISSAGCSQNIQKPVQGLRCCWSHQPATPFPTLQLSPTSCRNSGQAQACYSDLYILAQPPQDSQTYSPVLQILQPLKTVTAHGLSGDLLSSEQGHQGPPTATQDQSKWQQHLVLHVGLAVRALACFLARVN